MGNVLLPIVIVVLLLSALVILVALTWDTSLTAEAKRSRAAQGAFSSLEKSPSKRVREVAVRWARDVREQALALRSLTIALAAEWWPRLRDRARALAAEWWPRLEHGARVARYRRPTLESALESTTGQVIVVVALSLVGAYVIVAFAG